MKGKVKWIVLGAVVILLMIPSLIGDDDITGEAYSYVRDIPTDENESESEGDKEVIDMRGMPAEALGIITIKSLDIRYPIYEGATEAQLGIGIGHLPETAGLLETGNCVLCGHNGSSKGLFFTTLSHIRKGETVDIETKDERKRTYRVVSTKVVGPYDPTVRKETDKEILTLFTCAYHGTRRFVALCEPINDSERSSV